MIEFYRLRFFAPAFFAACWGVLIFPDWTESHRFVLISLLALGFVIDRLLNWYTSCSQDALPVIAQGFSIPPLLVSQLALLERSEFPHFETPFCIDFPFSFIAISLACVVCVVKLITRTRSISSFITAIYFLAFGLTAVLLTVAPFQGYFEFGITFPSILADVLVFGSVGAGEPSRLGRRFFALSVGVSVLISLFLIWDAYRLSLQEPCGESKVRPTAEFLLYLLSTEDPRFFLHNGVDLHRSRMAVREAFLSGELGRGGSTVTMQYAKVCYLTREKTLLRKLRQFVLSLLLEQRYSKSEILSRYLSSIPYGENTVGLRSAAKHYFLKDESQLSADESLSLVMTILDPERYNPHRTLTISELTRRAVIKARANKSRKRIEKHVEDILSELLDKGGI